MDGMELDRIKYGRRESWGEGGSGGVVEWKVMCWRN